MGLVSPALYHIDFTSPRLGVPALDSARKKVADGSRDLRGMSLQREMAGI